MKRMIALLLVFLFSIESFAAVVSDNDGSAFITKAEFDSLKNNFQAQIDSYNTSINNKIDGAIAAYLAGIQMEMVSIYDILDYYEDGIFSFDSSEKTVGTDAKSIWTPKVVPLSTTGVNMEARKIKSKTLVGDGTLAVAEVNFTGYEWKTNEYDARALIDGDTDNEGAPFKDAANNKYYAYKGWSDNGRTTATFISEVVSSDNQYTGAWFNTGSAKGKVKISTIGWELNNTDIFNGKIRGNAYALWMALVNWTNGTTSDAQVKLWLKIATAALKWLNVKRERVITVAGAAYECFTEKTYLHNVSNFVSPLPTYDDTKEYPVTKVIKSIKAKINYAVDWSPKSINQEVVGSPAEDNKQKGFPAVGIVKDIDNWENVFIEAYDNIAKDLYENNNDEPAVIVTTQNPPKYHLRTWAGWPLVKMSKSFAKGEYTVKFNDDSEYYVSLNQGPFGKSFDGNIKFIGGEAVPGKNYRKLKGTTKITWELDNHNKDSYIFLKWSKTNNELKGGGTLLPEKTVKLITGS